MEADESAMYIPSQFSAGIDWNDMRKKVDAVTNGHTPKEQTALIQEMLETDLPKYEEELKDRQKYLQYLPNDCHRQKRRSTAEHSKCHRLSVMERSGIPKSNARYWRSSINQIRLS